MTDIYTPEFFAEHHGTVTLSASVVVPIVMELLEPKSVLDIGCGGGEWLRAFSAAGALVAGVDIATTEFFQYDLTKPLDLDMLFDLVLCVEVAEHLPEESADTLVDTIVRHASQAVVFSAALPGQEGLHHVNCQPHEYWHQKFEQRGFEMSDPIRPILYEDLRVSWWYRQNLFVYQ